MLGLPLLKGIERAELTSIATEPTSAETLLQTGPCLATNPLIEQVVMRHLCEGKSANNLVTVKNNLAISVADNLGRNQSPLDPFKNICLRPRWKIDIQHLPEFQCCVKIL